METDKYYLQPFPSIILSHCTNLCILSTTFVKIKMSAPSVNYFTSFPRYASSKENFAFCHHIYLANLSISVQYSILDMRITVTREAKFTRSLTWKHNVSFRKRKKVESFSPPDCKALLPLHSFNECQKEPFVV